MDRSYNHLNVALWDEIGEKICRAGPSQARAKILYFFQAGPGSSRNFNFRFGPGGLGPKF